MDQHDDGRTARANRWALAWRLGALTLATTGALVGCGGHGATTASTTSSPTAAPSIDDSSATVLQPGASAAPGSDGASADGTASAPLDGAAATGTDPAATTPQTEVVTGGANAQTGVVPGIADRAVALPPAATVADDGRCGIADLKLAPLDLQGSPGGEYADFRLINVSNKACAVRGFVTATLIGGNGKDLVTSVQHEDAPDVWVKIEPKGSAQFHLRYPNPMSGSTPCNPPNAAKVRIGLSGVHGTLTSATPEGGIQACNGQLSTAPIGST